MLVIIVNNCCIKQCNANSYKPVLTEIPGSVTKIISDADRNTYAGNGFEGGKAVKDKHGTYWIFTAEFIGFPINANMRLALWKAPSANGTWIRHSTIANASSHGDNTNITTWNATCSKDNFHASPWAPFPIYDHKEGFWHVLWVSYSCDLSWSVRVGISNIMGARSTVPGEDGLSGPYKYYGIIIGPNATNPGSLQWGDLSECAPCFDKNAVPLTICGTDSCTWDNTKTGQAIAISPWVRAADNDTFLAFVGTTHVLASAPNVKGPWTMWNDPEVGQVVMSKMSTTSSVYCENPVVQTPIPDPDYPTWPNRTGYIAIYDTVSPSGGFVDQEWGWWNSGSSRGEAYGFGMAYSDWGYMWTFGYDVKVTGGVRTPLGLIREDDGTYTLIFTRRFANCSEQVLTPGSRGDSANDITMCANMYSVRFTISWVTWN